MNRNEVEQWMKESLGNKDYVPNEEAWKKLQEAIVPPAKKNKPLFIGTLPTGWKVAASVVLLIAAGTIIYFLSGNGRSPENRIAVTPERTQPIAPAYIPALPSVPPANIPGTTQIVSGKQRPPVINNVVSAPPDNNKAQVTPVVPAPNLQPTLAMPEPLPLQNDKKIAIVPKEDVLPQKPIAGKPDITPDFLEKDPGTAGGFRVGVAAQAGRASVGNMRYQLGIVARKNISTKFYTSATVAVTSTNVASSQQNTFTAVSFTTTNSIGSGVSSIVEEQSVQAHYGKDIISVGISPNIGYQVTPRLALIAGFALNHNLNQSLALTNEGSIDPVTLSSNVISSSQQISKWDAGVTGSASYNVSRKLAVDVQYRYGLSTYMHQGAQPVRNSGAGIGLNYMFGRP